METADRKRDKVGYDLEFYDGTRTRHIEVKGSKGSDVIFELTAQEMYRAQTDSDWFVIFVGKARENHPMVQVLSRKQILDAHYKPTGFLVQVG